METTRYFNLVPDTIKNRPIAMPQRDRGEYIKIKPKEPYHGKSMESAKERPLPKVERVIIIAS